MVPTVRSISQILLSPTAFFDDRPPAETLPVASVIVVVLALGLVGGILLLGSMLAGAVDATVTMDNPDRPPDFVCDQHADDPDSVFSEGCDEPVTIERDAGTLVQEAVRDYLWIGLVVPFVLWFIGAGVLYGVGRFAGGEPSFAGTLALAGWAALPELFRLAVGLVALAITLSGLTITDPERAVAVLQTAMAPIESVLLIASLVTVGWQWSLLTGGLSQEADVPWGSAAVGVAIPLGLFFLFGQL